eukprot:7974123-Pyramimonas_sp.AAC.2
MPDRVCELPCFMLADCLAHSIYPSLSAKRADKAEKEIADSTALLGPEGLQGVLQDLHLQLSQVTRSVNRHLLGESAAIASQAARDLEQVEWAAGALKEAEAIQAQAVLLRQTQDENLRANTKECQTEEDGDVNLLMKNLQDLAAEVRCIHTAGRRVVQGGSARRGSDIAIMI